MFTFDFTGTDKPESATSWDFTKEEDPDVKTPPEPQKLPEPKGKPSLYTCLDRALGGILPFGVPFGAPSLPEPRRPAQAVIPETKPETVAGAVFDPMGGGALLPPDVPAPFHKAAPKVGLRRAAGKRYGLGAYAAGVLRGLLEALHASGKQTYGKPTVMETVREMPLGARTPLYPTEAELRDLPVSAEVAGHMVGALPLIGAAQATGGRLVGTVLGRIAPRLVESPVLPARLATTGIEGFGTGATFGAGMAALEGRPAGETLAEAARSALFFGAGIPAGRLTEAGILRLAPAAAERTVTYMPVAAARGATVGGVGTAALLPTYPAEERPPAGEIVSQAGSLALFDALTALLGRPVPRRIPVPRTLALPAAAGPELPAAPRPELRPGRVGVLPEYTATEPAGVIRGRGRVEPPALPMTEYDRITWKDIVGLGRETPPPEQRIGPTPAEVDAARNLLKRSGLTLKRVARILDAYPELQAEFPQLAQKARKLITRPYKKPAEAVERPLAAPRQAEKPAEQQPEGQVLLGTEPKKTTATTTIKPIAVGKTATAKTERGTAVETEYAVVNARDLISSHTTALNPDNRYPAELQPRERSRIASRDQINNIMGRLEPEFLGESPKASEGAPIVGPDMIVESGNARVIALKSLYEKKHANADKYRAWLLENAERFGLDRKAIEKAQNPVLVRVRKSEVDRVQFAREANEQAVAAMSASEQAMADAKKMTGRLMDLFVPDEAGRVITTANQEFIKAFMSEVVGPAERGRYVTADGRVSQELVTRIRNAIFARAYGDPTALAKLAESTDNNVRNITNAMLMAGPRLAKIKEKMDKGELHDLDITGEITGAANKLSVLREQGMPVGTYLKQLTMFGEDLSPLAKDILAVFDDFSRSAKKLTALLNAYCDIVEAAGNPRQVSLIARLAPSKEEALSAAIRKVKGHEEAAWPTLFEGEAAGRTTTSEARSGVGGAKEKGPAGAPEVKGFPQTGKRKTPYDTAAIIKARKQQAEMPSTHLIDTPERNRLRGQIADELYGKGAPNKNRQAYIILGPPAAGKSSALSEPIARETGSLIIDSDLAKKKLPEFQGGKFAGVVHQESSAIAGSIYNRAMKNGDNIVLPLVGKNINKIRQIRDDLKAAGYEVHLRLVDLPPEKAAERAVNRFKETGRFVDPDYVLNKVGLLPRKNYDILKLEGGFDSYEAYSNDVPFGEPPRLLEKRSGAPAGGEETLRRGGRGRLTSGRERSAPGDEGERHVTEPKEIPVTAPKKPKTPASRVAILKKIEKLLLVPVREKRLWTRIAIGEYQPKAEVIRLRKPEDLPTLAHEVGHHLEKFLGIDPAPYALEFRPLGSALYPKATPTVQIKEGLAEFFRLYFTEPAKARDAAPRFYRDFEARLEREPGVREVIKAIQDEYQAWYKQSAVDRVKGAIVREQAKDPRHFLSPAERFYTDWKDDLYPIWKFLRVVTGAREIDILSDPYKIARLARGRVRKALALINRAMVSPDGKIIGPSLKEILEPIRKRADDFTAYITAKRALELAGRKIETGIDPKDAAETIRQLDCPEFRKAQEQLIEYQDNLLGYLIDAGVLSPERAKTFRELNRNYVPFYRFFGEETVTKGLAAGRKFADLPQPVKRIKGSARSVIDPLESIVKNTVYLIDIAERNRVARAVAQLADEVEGMGWLIERLPDPVQPTKVELKRIRQDLIEAGIPKEVLDTADLEKIAVIFNPVRFARLKEKRENILTVYRGGEPTFYQVHPDLYRALEMMDAPSANWFIRLLSYPARALRAGAILNPEFIMRNPARDQLTAFVQSKYGFIPVVDLVRGLYHVIGKTELYTKWEASGGAQATLMSLDRDYLQGQVRRLLEKEKLLEKTKRFAGAPLEPLRAASEALEEATRLGEFARGVKREAKKGTPEREALAKAAYASREVSLDFQRAGFKGRQANQMIAFFNAALEGPDKLRRAFWEDPVSCTIRAVAGITLPSIILWLVNHDDPRYQELPRWRKDLYWVIPGEENTLYFIPKPFEAGVIFGSFFERSLEAMKEDNPEEFKEWAKSMATVLSPGMIPNAFIPYFEAAFNYSFFLRRPIVPMREERFEAWAQYGPRTTEVAKRIAKAAKAVPWLEEGISPRKMEHLVRGYFGGLGMHALNLLDILSGKAMEKEEWFEAAPFVRAFAGAPYRQAESIEQLYDRLDRLEKRYSTLREQRKIRELDDFENAAELRRLRRVAKLLSKSRKIIREIQADERLSAKEKRERIDRINLRMVNIARAAIKRERIPERAAGR